MSVAAGQQRSTTPALGIAVALAVLVPTVTLGGYSLSSRMLFAGLAGLALLTALVFHEDRARELARTPVVLALVALAVLSAVSAAWSIDSLASLRWSLVIAAYAAVVVSAGAFAAQQRRGVELLAAVVAVAAAVSGAAGLVGAALHEEPLAQKIYHVWRPGGTFEYAPTLALVQVCALPALLYAMVRGRPPIAAAGAAGAAIAGGTLALSGSRLQVALCVVVLLAAPLASELRARAGGRALLFAPATVAACGAAVYACAREAPGDAGRLVAFAAVCALSAVAWGAARHLAARRGPPPPLPRVLTAVVVVVVIGLAAVSITHLTTRVETRDAGVTHGRLDHVGEVVDTARERPVLGHGADTYFAASEEHQSGTHTRYAQTLLLEAWAELGVLGALLVVGLDAAVLSAVWRVRRSPGAWLLVPAILAFLLTTLVDWPWHQAGAGAIWALAVGGVVGLLNRHPADTRQRDRG